MNETQRIPVVMPDGELAADSAPKRDMPLPHDPKTLWLAGIFIMMAFYTLYFVREIALPIILAGFLYLLLQPLMRGMARWRIPRAIAALLVISMLVGSMTGLGFVLSGPVSDWVAKAPTTLPLLQQRLAFIIKPMAKIQQTTDQLEQAVPGKPTVRTVAVKGPGLSSFLLSGTHTVVAGFLTIIVLLFFLLMSGDLFLRRLVEILPTLSDKKQAVEISNEIERHISGYLLTVSVMNAAVGVASGAVAYLCGLPDPLLWGTLAFVLNYILILGPITCAVAFLLGGLFTFTSTFEAVLPAIVYVCIHMIEGESVTPMLLARRMTLNPVLIIVSLVFWYWMWGIVGALLAVPLLATFKIICDRVRPLMAIGHFLGTEAPRNGQEPRAA
jgi:predicted PurR-regulated permease PerM